ncbi:MAG: TetR family transcriptional regulator [Bacteroidales bacterium]|nr:TetR family transcriptional regulator [Bacteroidales bacterium]
MDTKEHIKNIAIKLFSENGFDGTGVRQIAKEANVNVAMISYYFKSKESLLESAVDDVITQHLSFLEQVEKKQITPFEKLMRVINYNINFIMDNYQISKIVTFENKLNKRKNIEEKIKNLLQYIYNYMKVLILQHNSKLSAYKAELIPFMIHLTLFEFISNPSMVNFLAKGKISNLDDPEIRNDVKEKLLEFMTETTIKLIS